MQDLCMRISCARCLCQDPPRSCRSTCARSLYADLLCISLCQALPASRSCMTTCARSLYADLLCKISLSGCLRQDPVGPLWQDLCTRISCARYLFQDRCRTTCRRPPSRLHQRNFTGIPRDGNAPSRQRVALRNQKSQLYQHFARWTHIISAAGCTSKSEMATLPAFRAMDMRDQGCTWKSEIATLPAFRAMDTHTHTRSPQRVALRNPKSQIYQHSVMDERDLRRGLHLHFEIRNRNFTCIPCHQHARFPQRVVLRNQKSQLYLHSVPSTRTISAEGSLFETMLQKYCACHEIMSRGHTKCCTGHAIASSSSSSKNATPFRHVECNPSNDKRLPPFWQRPRNTAPATIFTTCPILCTCHVNSRF